MTEGLLIRRALHLVVAGIDPLRLEEIRGMASTARDMRVEVMMLDESNSCEALEKIFAADSVAVWGPLAAGK